METLSKILGSKNRVRVMRLFLLRPNDLFSCKKLARFLNISERDSLKELNFLLRIGFVRSRGGFEEVGDGKRKKKVRTKLYLLNNSFPYLKPLESLIISTVLVNYESLVRKFSKAGAVRLVVAAGVFLNIPDSRLDLLVVGDKMNKGQFGKILRNLEADIGKELNYALFELNDFRFRQSVGDRLIRDIFDFKHQVLLDKIGLTRPKITE